MKEGKFITIFGPPRTILDMAQKRTMAEAEEAVAAHPAVRAKRLRARELYVVSEGQVPNPDIDDWRRPAVSPEEAKEWIAKHGHKKGKEEK